MLKDQLIAFAALIPFLTAPIVAPKAPKIDPKAGKTATAVSMEPPLGNSNPKTSKADDKKPPVTTVPAKKEETNPPAKPEVKKEEVKVDPKKPEVKKDETKTTPPVKPEVKKDEVKVDPKKPELKKEESKTTPPVKPEVKKEEVKVDPKKPEVKKEETKTTPPVKPEVKKEEVKVDPKKPEVQKEETKTTPHVKPEVKKEETKPAEAKKEEKLSAQQLGTGDLLKLAPPLVVEEVTIGAGLKLAAQERAIIHFVVADSSGRELVNSKKRGLPFTVEPKPEGTDMWDVLLKDMRVGGSRRMTLTPPQVNGGKGLSPYIPAGVQVTVTIWLLRAARGK